MIREKLEINISEDMKERYKTIMEWFEKNYIDTEKVDGPHIEFGIFKVPLHVKPPLGIEPRFILRDKRIKEIREAINRYTESNIQIPITWIEEYNQLIKELK